MVRPREGECAAMFCGEAIHANSRTLQWSRRTCRRDNSGVEAQ